MKWYLEVAEDLQQMPKRQALANPLQNVNTVGGYKPRGFTTPSAPTSSISTSRKPPHLTEVEHSLLFKHQGCLKCRRGYQDHRVTDCPNNFPDGWSYKEIMEDMLLTHKHQGNILSGSRPVGAVTGASAHSEELAVDENPFVAGAIMPSAVLGSGSEMEEEVSPLTIPHLRWRCSLLGPAADELVTVNCMLDSGAHVVLIDNALVEKLG